MNEMPTRVILNGSTLDGLSVKLYPTVRKEKSVTRARSPVEFAALNGPVLALPA